MYKLFIYFKLSSIFLSKLPLSKASLKSEFKAHQRQSFALSYKFLSIISIASCDKNSLSFSIEEIIVWFRFSKDELALFPVSPISFNNALEKALFVEFVLLWIIFPFQITLVKLSWIALLFSKTSFNSFEKCCSFCIIEFITFSSIFKLSFSSLKKAYSSGIIICPYHFGPKKSW